MEHDTITLKTDGNLGKIQLNLPESRNAMSSLMFKELNDSLKALRFDSNVRCILITGSGEYFSVGAELKETKEKLDVDDDKRRGLVYDDQRNFHEMIYHIRETPIPIIAGVNGPAAGGGFGVAISCDLTILSEDAHMTYAFSRIGLSDAGTTYFLPRLVGLKKAMDIVIRNQTISPEEAVDMGLATETKPPETFIEDVENLAKEISEGPTKAYGYTKKLMAKSMDRSLRRQLGMEEDAILEEVMSADFEEGIEAFVEGRDPDFIGK